MCFDEIEGFTMEARKFNLEQGRVCPIYSVKSYPDSH
jgi:hypothetical protein